MSSKPNPTAAPKVNIHKKKTYFTRTDSKQKRIEMYRDRGHLSHELPDAKIAPDRKYFGNVRTITQDELAGYRNAYKEATSDPFTVILHQQQLPKSLVEDAEEERKFHLLKAESYQDTFGPKAQRRKPTLNTTDLKTLIKDAEAAEERYDNRVLRHESVTGNIEMGQTKRVLGEVYKVIDSSDVIIEVLDARDPLGTRSLKLEEYMLKECPHKHLIFLINKVDLVPKWVAEKALRALMRERPTLAFRASTDRPFGDDALLNLLRQFQSFHKDKAHLCVGFVGYPNVGKSLIINSLRRENVCPTAPIPGETKVWRYIALTKRIYLIDCPGHVYPEDVTDAERVLRSVTRTEKIREPEHYIQDILDRVRPEYLKRTYGIPDWTDVDDFLEKLAKRLGRLGKRGIPDVHAASLRLIADFQRGRLPWFVLVHSKDIVAAPSVKRHEVRVVKPDFEKVQRTVEFDAVDEEAIVDEEDDRIDKENEILMESDMQPVKEITAEDVGDTQAPSEKKEI